VVVGGSVSRHCQNDQPGQGPSEEGVWVGATRRCTTLKAHLTQQGLLGTASTWDPCIVSGRAVSGRVDPTGSGGLSTPPDPRPEGGSCMISVLLAHALMWSNGQVVKRPLKRPNECWCRLRPAGRPPRRAPRRQGGRRGSAAV